MRNVCFFYRFRAIASILGEQFFEFYNLRKSSTIFVIGKFIWCNQRTVNSILFRQFFMEFVCSGSNLFVILSIHCEVPIVEC